MDNIKNLRDEENAFLYCAIENVIYNNDSYEIIKFQEDLREKLMSLSKQDLFNVAKNTLMEFSLNKKLQKNLDQQQQIALIHMISFDVFNQRFHDGRLANWWLT